MLLEELESRSGKKHWTSSLFENGPSEAATVIGVASSKGHMPKSVMIYALLLLEATVLNSVTRLFISELSNRKQVMCNIRR